MNNFGKSSHLVLFILTLTVFPSVNYSQRLYDKTRDGQAQKALELAEPLKNASVFEKMMRNLANRTKLDFETEFLVKKFEINAQSISMLTWRNAHEYVCGIQLKNTNIPQIPSADVIRVKTTEVKEKIKTTKKSLARFECAIKEGIFDELTSTCKAEKESDPTLTSLFDRLGDLKSVIEFSEKLNEKLPGDIPFNPKTLAALEKIKGTIEQLQGVYDQYTAKVKEYNALAEKLGDMKLALKKIALQSLQVDEEHLKNVAAIKARLETEQGDIFALISRYRGYVSRLELTPPFKINVTDQSSDDFCVAKEDDSFAYKNNWMIVEHLKEMVQHSKRLEKDNQEIQSKAKLALLKLNKGVDTDSSIRDTLASIKTAKINIEANEIIHLRELQLSCPKDGDESKNSNICLSNFSKSLTDADNSEKKKQALQNIIAFSYTSTVKNRDMVAIIPQAIYDLAALISRGDTPVKLAELRLATEYQAYSIRKSAIRVRAYELAVSTGAQRLSLFYKGGIKPETIAGLVFAISNVAIPPAILAK